MKVAFAAFVLVVLTLSSAKPFFVQDDNRLMTAQDLKRNIIGFITGLGLYDKLHPSDDCLKASDVALDYAVSGINNYAENNIYNGTLDISDSLGALSPLARVCDQPLTTFATLIQNYPNQFTSVYDFLLKFALNMVGNVKPLIDKTLFVYRESQGHGNLTAILQTAAEMLNLQITINDVLFDPIRSDVRKPVVNFTWSDPLAATPTPHRVWIIFESIYNLLVNSKFISREHLVGCEESTLNMVLFNLDAYTNFNKNQAKNGLLSVVDSFTFLHKAVETCTNTGVEIGQRGAEVAARVIANPSVIFTNLFRNIFFVVSDGMFAYSENYYGDAISFTNAIADFLYRTVITE